MKINNAEKDGNESLEKKSKRQQKTEKELLLAISKKTNVKRIVRTKTSDG